MRTRILKLCPTLTDRTHVWDCVAALADGSSERFHFMSFDPPTMGEVQMWIDAHGVGSLHVISADPPARSTQPAPSVDYEKARAEFDGFKNHGFNVIKYEALKRACQHFINTVDATGGLIRNETDEKVPAGDPEWADLADAYLSAQSAMAIPDDLLLQGQLKA